MEPLLQVSDLKIVFDSGRGTVQAVGGRFLPGGAGADRGAGG